jgi:hypothetical protein
MSLRSTTATSAPIAPSTAVRIIGQRASGFVTWRNSRSPASSPGTIRNQPSPPSVPLIVTAPTEAHGPKPPTIISRALTAVHQKMPGRERMYVLR